MGIVRYNRYALFFFVFCSYCSSSPPTEKNRSHTVEIRQMKFSPAELILEKGDTVLFVNHDFLTHDVTEQTRKAWTSSYLSPDSSWRIIVNATYDYYCTIHPVMKGRLIVE
jgi:plastocyanin